MTRMNFYLYGPPGSGKSSLGSALALSLGLPFLDLDELIAGEAGMSIPDIFRQESEAGFRQREKAALESAARGEPRVVALGGGALIDPDARRLAEETGQILCLSASLENLISRLDPASGDRPLLAGNLAERLSHLLAERADHYRSFEHQLVVDGLEISELVWKAQQQLGAFRVSGMGPAYDVRIQRGGLGQLGSYFSTLGLKDPVAVVTDNNVAGCCLENVMTSLKSAGYQPSAYCIEPGEEHKTIETVLSVWDFFIKAGIERRSTVVALGGGVVGDLTGFAAAAFLRGVAWVNLPTTLLAMVDSSLGGKTGVDLPQAKNLVGSFYPPRLVLADPEVLGTLPARELRGGLAEVIKHGIIDDPELFNRCAEGWPFITGNIDWVVRRGMAVKLKVISADPYEKGLRQALNLGHTIGHGIEIASNFQLTHGESVAIGMAAEAHLAEVLHLAEPGLKHGIVDALKKAGLPTTIPMGLDLTRVVEAMQLDKKRAAGKVQFALPVRIGEVRTGVVIDGWQQIILNGWRT